MYRRSAVVLAVVVALTWPRLAAIADIVSLKTGDVLSGRVVAMDIQAITVITDAGNVRIPRNAVLRVKYTDPEAENRARDEEAAKELQKWLRQFEADLALRTSEEKTAEKQSGTRRQEESEFFKDEILEEKRRRKKAAAWRSLIIPGWGQAYKDEARKGLVTGGMALGFFAGASLYKQAYSASQNSFDSKNVLYAFLAYERHSIPYALLYYNSTTADQAKMIKSGQRVQAFGALVLLVYAYAIADAFLKDPNLGWESEYALTSPRSDESDRVSAAATSGPPRSGDYPPALWSVTYVFRF